MKTKLRSKKNDVEHEAVKASAYMEKRIEAERQRAVDYGVRMEQENAQLREELKSVKTENDMLKNWTVSLRQRIYTLLRSIEVDSEVFSLPKMEIEDPDAMICAKHYQDRMIDGVILFKQLKSIYDSKGFGYGELHFSLNDMFYNIQFAKGATEDAIANSKDDLEMALNEIMHGTKKRDPDAIICGIPGGADDHSQPLDTDPPTISELRKKYGLEEEDSL